MVGKLSRRVFLSAARMVTRVPHIFVKLLDMLNVTSSTHYARMRRRLLAIAEEMDILDAIHMGVEELQSGSDSHSDAFLEPAAPHNSPCTTERNSPTHGLQQTTAKVPCAGLAGSNPVNDVAERLSNVVTSPVEFPKPPVQARNRPRSQCLNSPSSSQPPSLPSVPTASAFPPDSPKALPRNFAAGKLAQSSPGAQRKSLLHKGTGGAGCSSKDPEKMPTFQFTQARPLPSNQIHWPKPSLPAMKSDMAKALNPVTKSNMRLDLQEDSGHCGGSAFIPSEDAVFTPVDEKFCGLDASAELNSSIEDLLEASVPAADSTVTFQSEVAVLSTEQVNASDDAYSEDVTQNKKCKEKMEAEEEEALAVVMAMSESQDALPVIPQLQVEKGEDVIIIQLDVSSHLCRLTLHTY